MKTVKFGFIFVSALVLAIGFGSTGHAFHDGGVAYCDGCHTMHNSSGNAKMTVGANAIGTANAYLLKGSDQSSTCLNCHGGTGTSPSSYKVATTNAGASVTPAQLTPGGDFGWLKKSYTWTAPRTGSSPGDRHGHNIVATDFGFAADATLATAPGGTYDATKLACSSCHDPHGKYRIIDAAGTTIQSGGAPIHASGSYGELPTAAEAVGVYRLLAGSNYAPKSYNAVPFANNSPVAVVPSSYNRSETATDTRVAYGKGMSEWCSNCHTVMHNDSYPSNLRHPAGNGGKLTGAVVANYNAYKKTGDMTGVAASSYTSLIPFEKGTTDLAALTTVSTSTTGADTSDNVLCLTCHRAHAAGFKSMSRWNNAAEFLTEGGAYADPTTLGNVADGKTPAEYQQAMYGRPASAFATFQRSLCNKCHAKD